LRILILTPIKGKVDDTRRKEILDELSELVTPDVELDLKSLEHGATTIESFYDEYIGAADMIEKGLDAERAGYNAVVINCFMNPALNPLRELLNIPVIGAGEAALSLASVLGDFFSILDPDPPPRSYSHKIVSSLGLSNKLRSVRYLGLGVSGLSGRFEDVLELMISEAKRAVEEDGAHVIVLGCTGMRRYSKKLSEEMNKYGVPLIEPLSAAINLAVSIVRLGLSHSKLSYPNPLKDVEKENVV
jgi:allantoin racemase